MTAAVLVGADPSGDMVRIIKTVSLFLSMHKLIVTYAPNLILPFTYPEFFEVAKNKVKWQIELISHTDKLAGFFKAIEGLINSEKIIEGMYHDISTPEKLTLKTDGKETKQISLAPGTKVLFIRLSNLFKHYTDSSHNTEGATESTIEQNLRSNPAYIGKVTSRRFKWKVKEIVAKSLSNNEAQSIIKEYSQNTSCIALYYDKFHTYFDIDLERHTVENPEETTTEREPREVKSDQPF